MKKSTGHIKKTFQLFLLFLLCWGVALGGVLLVYYRMETGSYEQALIEKAEHSLLLQQKMAYTHFAMIISDLKFLAKEEELKSYLTDPTAAMLAQINREYLSFSRNKKNYEQIRFLDNKGMEVVRVNFNGGTPVGVGAEQLQSKHDRYYFKDAFSLDNGAVFVSPFDLNIEHGQVEVPYKPMIRFATPVFDQQGVKRGLILINYLGQDLLNFFLDINSGVSGQTMLVNRDGFWLLHPDSDREWGFMFEGHREIGFAQMNPEVWAQIHPSFSGQIRTSQGIYVYNTIVPLDSDVISSTGAAVPFGASSREICSDEYYWKSITFIPSESLSASLSGLRVNLFGLGGMLFLFGTFGLWPLAEMQVKRRIYQEQLVTMAHFDALTGLPNRTLFFDRFHQAIHLAIRYERLCALLYIDLDGFKLVNDTLGHDAGDELLIEAGRRMKECCRASDTVARLGGDEFIVLLSEVAAADGAEILARQILQAFEAPFELKKGQAVVGASIGISVFPTHGMTSEELLKSADRAMYLSKKQGKNTYNVADKI
ncbi:MAG: GGDEF domain-containing protein [Desulfuromusa sp.]|nr:GGDEF domain-containing protein [Desulfuromusa sp.]